jgi:hypothetical protein
MGEYGLPLLQLFKRNVSKRELILRVTGGLICSVTQHGLLHVMLFSIHECMNKREDGKRVRLRAAVAFLVHLMPIPSSQHKGGRDCYEN